MLLCFLKMTTFQFQSKIKKIHACVSRVTPAYSAIKKHLNAPLGKIVLIGNLTKIEKTVFNTCQNLSEILKFRKKKSVFIGLEKAIFLFQIQHWKAAGDSVSCQFDTPLVVGERLQRRMYFSCGY